MLADAIWKSPLKPTFEASPSTAPATAFNQCRLVIAHEFKVFKQPTEICNKSVAELLELTQQWYASFDTQNSGARSRRAVVV